MEERCKDLIRLVPKAKYEQSYSETLREQFMLMGGKGEDFTEEVAFEVMHEL